MAVPQQQRSDSLHEHETSAPQALWETEAAELTHIEEKCELSYTPTSAERLWQSSEDRDQSPDDPNDPETVLYLAYGSNMCAQTFLGMRKIRPLSEVNVSAPSLNLTLSLPGFPYLEACFANVSYRERPEKETQNIQDGKWDGSMMGVVYEVTKEDWGNIMRTEGGGTSYNEILVPCVPLPRASTIASDAAATTKSRPQRFLARTLYAPRLPKSIDPSKRSWWERLTTGPYRPSDNYAQPSLRYLNLLRVGAKEHDLPKVYRDYLDDMEPYTMTTLGQKIGKGIMIVVYVPLLLFIVKGSALLADETGKLPKPFATIMTILSNSIWATYDYIMKPIFGDGERTVEENSHGKEESANGLAEKAALLSEDGQ